MSRLGIRVETLLVLGCAAGAAALAASELIDTFRLTQPGVGTLQGQAAADRHHYALLLLAIFALAALVAAIATGSKPAATAVSVAGGIALLIFLIVDLPDANQVGVINNSRQSFIDAKAVPEPGFYLELAGALALLLCGTALARLPADRLRRFGTPPDPTEQKRRPRPKPAPPLDWSKDQ